MHNKEDKIKKLFSSIRRGDTSALIGSNNGTQTEHKNQADNLLKSSATEESEHKRNTDKDNGTQTEHKITKESLVKPKGLYNNGTQTEHKTEKPRLTEHKSIETEHKRNTYWNTNGTQTEHKTVDITSLPNLQKNVLNGLFNSAKINGGNLTKKLNIDAVSELSGVNKNSVKTTICRLRARGIVSILSRQDGRGGSVIYEIDRQVYLELLLMENGTQTEHKRNTYWNTEAPSSSRYIKTTTENGQIIDIKPLAKIGFTENHLQQVLDAGKLTSEQIQASIERYAYDLYKNDKVSKIAKPINYFIKVLKLGHEYAEPEGYESEETKLLRENIERLERQQAEREANLKRLEELKFNEWYEGLGASEKEALRAKFPAITRGKDEGHPMVRGEFKNYFKNEVEK